MPHIQKRLDIWSRLVILVTFALFVAALFFKGFGHDLLLEAGVFLVSIKLIMMAYRNSVASADVVGRLDALQQALVRVEEQTRAGRATGHAEVKTG
jgi:hypothetical protein